MLSDDVEKDNESSLGDNPTGWLGVRKYDDFTGRFFQIDPLWEKYYGWTTYHYSANNPVNFLDPGGMKLNVFFDKEGTQNEYLKLGKDDHQLLCNTTGYSKEMISDIIDHEETVYLLFTTRHGTGYDKNNNVLYYNPLAVVPANYHSSENAPGFIILAHEFGHALRDIEGRHVNKKERKDGVPIEEIENIQENENPVRQQFKEKLFKQGFETIRTHYNGIRIIEDEKQENIKYK